MSTVYFNLAAGSFAQDWNNTGLLTGLPLAADDWAKVPSIAGYRGDGLTAATGVDPQTVTGDSAVFNVIANQTNPNTLTTGGIAEFELADPTIAVQGSGTAAAPAIVLYLDATNRQNVKLSFDARDIDGSSDNAVQPLAIQYRLDNAGPWVNLPAGFVADATTGPNLATLVTPVSVTLPGAVNNQAQLQVRILTTNAAGSDEWIGIDNIVVTSDTFVQQPQEIGFTADSLAVARLEGNTGTTAFTFTIQRTNGTAGEVAFSGSVAAGSTDGADYPTGSVPPSFAGTIAAGASTATVTVAVAGDTVVEPNESFSLTLLSATNSDPTIATPLSAAVQATGTLIDDDASTIGGIAILAEAPSLHGVEGASPTTPPTAGNTLNLVRLGAFTPAGTIPTNSNAESVSFDPGTGQLFILNTNGNRIDIVKISRDGALTGTGSIDLTGLTEYGGANSVAVKNGIVAVGYANATPDQPGYVALFDIAGALLKLVPVGVLPDMVTFTPDGSKVLSANEAEAISSTNNPVGSVSIIDLSNGAANATVANTISFAALNGNETLLRQKGVEILPGQAAAADIEPEYISVSADGSRAFVTLQEVNAVAVIDLTNPAVDRPLALLPLGGVDHSLPGNEFDASDQNGIAIKANDVIGLLQPDSIASFQRGGATYFITANEGDARVGTGIADSTRLGSASYVLDPTAYPNAAALKANTELGRLNVLTNVGDTDGDGDFDQIYTLGGRGFSIFKQNPDGTIAKVYESGGAFEKIIAAQQPAMFNQNQAVNTADSRSDDKGPEPEGVDIATIGGRTYAFIGLERVGGLMVYDVTDPANASFVRFVPPQSNEFGPEVVKVIPSDESPTGKTLVVTANEVSGTTTVYQVDLPKIASGSVDQDSAVLWGKATALGNASFQVATDAGFANIIASSNQTVTDLMLPVKAEIVGLQANTAYYYRFLDSAAVSLTGQFSTAARLVDGKLGLSFGVSGDWRGELAPYPALSNADSAGLKFFVELGDTIYADYPSPAVPTAQATTLGDYRAKHDEVYSDRDGLNTLGDLRATTPVISMLDDHEVTNDFAGGAPAASDPRFNTTNGLINQTPLYQNGVQAFVEYNPIQPATYSGTGNPTVDGRPNLYSSGTYGKDAAVFTVDARSFRSTELPGVANLTDPAQIGSFLAQSFTPGRTLLGQPQFAKLEQDLLSAQANGVTWKFVMLPEPIENFGVLGASDRYEGYAAERTALLKFINDNYVSNVVFVSADIHGTSVNNLTYQTQPGGPQIGTGAFEITTGSVAFDAPFGQTVADLATAAGLLTPQQKAFYDSLPIAPDSDNLINDKDDFLKSLINQQLAPLGYDPIGLDNNLAVAQNRINATLQQGDYLVAHTYGWTKFDIDPTTQALKVTTYGIDPYTEADLQANPGAVVQTPRVLSQFTVQAQPTVTAIPTIQGTGQLSPLAGQAVTTQGVVTALDTNGSRGFYLQDPNGDGNAATSDGIFVFLPTGSLPTVGHLIQVTGTVQEFTPNGAAAGSFSTTELSSVTTVTDLGVGPTITPVQIGGVGGIVPPTESLIAGGKFYESLEGMLVKVVAPTAVGPTNNFGEIFTVVDNDANPANGLNANGQTARGNLLLTPGNNDFGDANSSGGDFNPERIQIDDDNGVLSGFASPQVDVGAKLQDVTGILRYDFGNYEVIATQAYGVAQASPLVKETTTLAGDRSHLLVASYNAENLDPKLENIALVSGQSASNVDDDLGAGKFDTIAGQILNTLRAPDIVALQEVQDNDGAELSSVTSANLTLQTLVAKINALAGTGGAHYAYIDNPFIGNGTNGGQPGGNIRTAYLYRDDRVQFVAGSLRTIASDGSAVALPGNSDQRTNPDNPFFSSRPPLAADFVFNGTTVTVVNNHFTSKGGSAALLGSDQPPLNAGEVQRAAQAQAVNNYVDRLLQTDPNAKVIVAGDLNEFPFEEPMQVIRGTATVANYDVPGTDPFNAVADYTPGGTAVLTDLQDLLPADQRYDYVFEGNSETLDHVLVSNGLVQGAQFDVVRINAEFADQTSDHDPLVASFEIAPPTFTLQLLHFYGETGTLATQTAPILGAMVDKFDDQYANTLILAEGDTWIPGPWLVGGADPSLNTVPGIGATALGRPDVAIMNAIGVDASALGNHEFDLGSPVVAGAIAGSGAWVGAQFPFITDNLDFSADSSLRGLADASLGGTASNAFAGKEANTIKGKIAPSTVVTMNGEKVGIVGATTFDLLTKTSPNGTKPKDDGNPATSDLEEVAAYIQAAVDGLRAQGINKIVMVDQLDTIERNRALAPLVSGIDIMVAGGGHERLGDATDVPGSFNGHSPDFIADSYPIVTAGKDGAPTLIVTTDTEYTYLGRLVATFDGNGELILNRLDPAIDGAYAANEATLQQVYGTADSAATIVAGSTIGTKVKAIADAIDAVVTAKDGNKFGFSNVYLEGDRVFGRAQETNLGDITADANAWKAQQALGDLPYLVSLKNGGGLRASIGSIDEDGGKIANPVVPGAAGNVSQLDVENALRFDNKLMVFDTTPQGLLNILNWGAGLAAGNGGFPQIGGVRFSYDPSLPGSNTSTGQVGSRILNVALIDEDGGLLAKVVENGAVVAGAPAKISVVALNFTANGGDGYPIKANADNFRYLLSDGTLTAPVDEALDFTAAANVPANALGEQKAFEDFLQAVHGSSGTAYNTADTPASQDIRIENLAVRPDAIFANQAPAIIGDLAVTVAEGQPVTLTTTDLTEADPDNSGNALTYAVTAVSHGQVLVNGAAASGFTQTQLATGQVSFLQDGSKVPTAGFTVTLTDAGGLTSAPATVTATVTLIDDAPVLTSPNAFSVPENTTAVATLTAADPDGPALVFSIASGPDQALFTVNPTTGALAFNQAPDFEAPADAGADNTYNLTVQASDGTLTATQAIAITVTDVSGVTIEGTRFGDRIDATHTVVGQPLPTGEADLINGAGGNDRLSGLAGDDLLNGGSGADTMTGGPGNDTYIVDSRFDDVIEAPGEGYDTIRSTVSLTLPDHVEALELTGNADLDGTGNELDNALYGNTGNNRLDGGAGADTLAGGAGGDTYLVDDPGDQVIEAANQGNDTVRTTLSSYALGPNLENLVFTGSGSFEGSGNALANRITGGAGDDLLIGGAGDDRLTGGSGNDILIGGADADALFGGTGNDTAAYVGSSAGVKVSLLTLTGRGGDAEGDFYNSIENLTGSSFDDLLTGNLGANQIDGGDGDDILVGAYGADRLTGGAGADQFFYAAPFEGRDLITDFTPGQDKIAVYSPNFGNLPVGPLNAANFGLTPSGSAPQFVFNAATGALTFDLDGAGRRFAAVTIATLSGVSSLSASDLQVLGTMPN